MLFFQLPCVSILNPKAVKKTTPTVDLGDFHPAPKTNALAAKHDFTEPPAEAPAPHSFRHTMELQGLQHQHQLLTVLPHDFSSTPCTGTFKSYRIFQWVNSCHAGVATHSVSPGSGLFVLCGFLLDWWGLEGEGSHVINANWIILHIASLSCLHPHTSSPLPKEAQ